MVSLAMHAQTGRAENVMRLLLGGVAQAAGLLVRARRTDLVYLPYPAPITLWWISFVPERWRPRCIADAYISLWDSMFRDRKGGDVEGLVSKMVRAFEGRIVNIHPALLPKYGGKGMYGLNVHRAVLAAGAGAVDGARSLAAARPPAS